MTKKTRPSKVHTVNANNIQSRCQLVLPSCAALRSTYNSVWTINRPSVRVSPQRTRSRFLIGTGWPFAGTVLGVQEIIIDMTL